MKTYKDIDAHVLFKKDSDKDSYLDQLKEIKDKRLDELDEYKNIYFKLSNLKREAINNE